MVEVLSMTPAQVIITEALLLMAKFSHLLQVFTRSIFIAVVNTKHT